MPLLVGGVESIAVSGERETVSGLVGPTTLDTPRKPSWLAGVEQQQQRGGELTSLRTGTPGGAPSLLFFNGVGGVIQGRCRRRKSVLWSLVCLRRRGETVNGREGCTGWSRWGDRGGEQGCADLLALLQREVATYVQVPGRPSCGIRETLREPATQTTEWRHHGDTQVARASDEGNSGDDGRTTWVRNRNCSRLVF